MLFPSTSLPQICTNLLRAPPWLSRRTQLTAAPRAAAVAETAVSAAPLCPRTTAAVACQWEVASHPVGEGAPCWTCTGSGGVSTSPTCMAPEEATARALPARGRLPQSATTMSGCRVTDPRRPPFHLPVGRRAGRPPVLTLLMSSRSSGGGRRNSGIVGGPGTSESGELMRVCTRWQLLEAAAGRTIHLLLLPLDLDLDPLPTIRNFPRNTVSKTGSSVFAAVILK